MDEHRCLAEITEVLETEYKIQVTPGLRQLINDLAHKIDTSPSEDMAVDHILVIGSDRKQIKSFLAATEVTLRIVRLSEPFKHEGSGKGIVEIVKELRNSSDENRFKYLLLKWLDGYPFEPQANINQFFELMEVMRVVATLSPGFKRLPTDIEKMFRIRVDLDRETITDCNMRDDEAQLIKNQLIGKNGVQAHRNTNQFDPLEKDSVCTQSDDYVVTNSKLRDAFGWSGNTIATWSEKAGVEIIKIGRKNAMKTTDIVKVKAFHKKYARS